MSEQADLPRLQWRENDAPHEAQWRSLTQAPPPAQVKVVDDSLTADQAYGLACQGIGLLWRGDYHQARQMLTAMARRADRQNGRAARDQSRAASAGPDAFHRYRQARAQRARALNALLIPLAADYRIPLRRAPDVREACFQAFGPATAPQVMPLRALQGVIGAQEWRRHGIEVPEVGGRIHPHFGVFAPIRREYVDLVAQAPLPTGCRLAFDIGTGTGVLAAVLARRGAGRVVATDLDARAVDCARGNLRRLGLAQYVEVRQADLFPEGRASLVVCNPPWLPARPSSSMESALYDADGGMLRGFLQGLPAHLEPGGEGWLVLSDLAEHLGLRSRAQLLEQFDAAGLRVIDRLDARPRHPRAADADDVLHAARAAEVTSLWRLVVK